MSFTKNNIFGQISSIASLLPVKFPYDDTPSTEDHEEHIHVMNPDDYGIRHSDDSVNEDFMAKNTKIVHSSPSYAEMAVHTTESPHPIALHTTSKDLENHYSFTNGSETRVNDRLHTSVYRSHSNETFMDEKDGYHESISYAENPTHVEQHHIRDYTGVDSKTVNKALFLRHQGLKAATGMRHQKIGAHILNTEKYPDSAIHPDGISREHKIDSNRNLIAGLDSALKQKSPTKLSLFSGMKRDPRQSINPKNGILHMPGYMSTSIGTKTAMNFANSTGSSADYEKAIAGQKDFVKERHIMKIHWPEGSKGAYVAHISRHPGEREFILPRNIGLKYHKTTTHEGVHDGYTGKDTYHFHVHEFYPVYGHKD